MLAWTAGPQPRPSEPSVVPGKYSVSTGTPVLSLYLINSATGLCFRWTELSVGAKPTSDRGSFAVRRFGVSGTSSE